MTIGPWIQGALLFSFAWNVWMSVEGKLVSPMPCFMALVSLTALLTGSQLQVPHLQYFWTGSYRYRLR